MQPSALPLNPDTFRRVLSEFATGITVVTVRADEIIHGLTANAFCSVSLVPPLVLVCVDRNAHSHDLIARARCFAVNILTANQQKLAERFSRAELEAAQRFAGVSYHVETTGAPVFDECLGWLDCRLVAAHAGGDHTIYVGEVAALGKGRSAAPLLYFRSRYTTLPHKPG